MIVIVIFSYLIYFFYSFIDYNSEYVSSEGTANKDSICKEIDTFRNNSKIGTRTSCNTFIKFPPAISSTGASYDSNTVAQTYFFDTKTKRYLKGDKIQVYYKPVDIDRSATINIIPNTISWTAIIVSIIMIILSIILTFFK